MLYYIHGYQSSPTGTKALLFKKQLQAHPITYRQCPPEDLRISDCLTCIAKTIKKDPHVTLIGSSLGGFLAASTALTHSTVKHCILLNPAIIPPQTSIHTIKDMPQTILKDMKNPEFFTKKIPADILIIRGTQDIIVPDFWVYFFAIAQEATVRFLNDDHQFSKNLEKLPGIISSYLNK